MNGALTGTLVRCRSHPMQNLKCPSYILLRFLLEIAEFRKDVFGLKGSRSTCFGCCALKQESASARKGMV